MKEDLIKIEGAVDSRAGSAQGSQVKIHTAEDLSALAPSLDSVEASSLPTPEELRIISNLAPIPKQDYAIAGAGMYADIAGNSKPILTEKGRRSFSAKVEEMANEIEARNVLFGINDKGEIYNTLTAYERAFIIALRVLLSDSTVERHAIIENKRKEKEKEYTGEIGEYEGIDFFGACRIRPEAYDIFFKKEESLYYNKVINRPTPQETALLGLGFTPSDIIVVIDKNTFIRDYLGGSVGGKQSKVFANTIQRLSAGRVAFVGSTTKAGRMITDNLLRRVTSFYGEKKGQRVEYHAISLHPIFARAFTPNYITYPANNAEILGAILKVSKGAEGLLNLYDLLLKNAARNYEKIKERPGIQVFTLKESEILPFITTEARLKKNKKETIERLYSDTGINLFFAVGLLAERVTAPTEADRNRAIREGKDVEITIHYKRIAGTYCKR